MHDRPLRDDEYEDDDAPMRVDRAVDPFSATIGSTAYAENHVIDECRETFHGGVYREPETFDRFYFGADPKLLLDILPDFTPDELEEARQAKHVEFKTRWCAENDRRYVAITESAAENPVELRELLTAAAEPPSAPAAKTSGAAKRKTPAKRAPTAKRGQVSRPKAAA